MRIVLIVFAILSSCVSASDKTLQVAVNIGPPWAFYHEEQGVTGIDVAILRKVLGNLGYATEFHLLAYNRLISDFKKGEYDVASPAAFSADNGYLTDRYLPFKDVVVSLKKNHIEINTLADLADKRIVAYQFATSVLGPDYAKTVEQANYLEIAEREVQITLLVKGRTDVVIGEQRLLTYILSKLYPDQELAIHPIFVTKHYGAITKDKDLQVSFDKELKKLQDSGEYQSILNQWRTVSN